MAFDRTKPADTDYISASAANLRENFRALAEDTRLYGEGVPDNSAGQDGWRYVDTSTGDEYLKVNNAWIKKTDLAALIATLLGEDIYKRSNIIGTVGQISGVPIGAVIERGSNSNGEYVKFADGTAICFINKTVSIAIATAYNPLYQGQGYLTLPLIMTGVFAYAGSFSYPGYPCWPGRIWKSSDSASVTFNVMDVASRPTADCICSVICIGRWF